MIYRTPINDYIQFQERDSDILDFLKKYAKFNYTYTSVIPGSPMHKLADWLENMPDGILKMAANRELYIIIDFSYEAYNSTDQPIYDSLYFSIEKYNIPPEQLIYMSANMDENKCVEEYCKKHNKEPITVCCFSTFEFHTPRICDYSIYNLTIEEAKETFENNFTDKLFCSLSRVNRPWRSYATWQLHKSDIAKDGYISHDSVDTGHFVPYFLDSKDKEEWIKWSNQLPLFADTSDFYDEKMTHVFDQNIFTHTGFHIVNESFVSEENTRFLTEKTFKSMLVYQPLIIWGQVGANHYLESLGYKLYNDWFDLSFDFEPDNIKRYHLMLNNIKRTIYSLKSKTRNEIIDWRFKNQEILNHNKQTLLSYKYEHSSLMTMIEKINDNKSN